MVCVSYTSSVSSNVEVPGLCRDSQTINISAAATLYTVQGKCMGTFWKILAKSNPKNPGSPSAYLLKQNV